MPSSPCSGVWDMLTPARAAQTAPSQIRCLIESILRVGVWGGDQDGRYTTRPVRSIEGVSKVAHFVGKVAKCVIGRVSASPYQSMTNFKVATQGCQICARPVSTSVGFHHPPQCLLMSDFADHDGVRAGGRIDRGFVN